MKNLNLCLRLFSITAILLFFMQNINAQDARNSQSFYSNPLKVNPAIMGMNTDLKAIVNYRTQWGSVGEGYTTSNFTGIYPLYLKDSEYKLDLGFNVLSDKAAAFSTLDISMAIGYNLQVSNSGFLSLSLSGGLIQKSLDATNLNFDDQYVLGMFDASNPTNANIASDVVSYPSIGFGLMWYFNPPQEDAMLNAYIGVSGYHLNEPNETMLGTTGVLPKRISYQGGLKILGEGNLNFTPNFIVTTQSGSEEVAAGLYVDYVLNESSKLVLGSWYRKNDAYAVMLAFDHKSFFIGYSYDITTSQISSSITGLNTHEITLSYKMNMAEKKGVEANKSLF
ncbi:MAG: PorP/SprF family type IX secretion system membrane protein [Bacteroidetes bacterium]|nr:PorP/SprF family type IX secretion system membrane protein [Bacteroidota bacterium]